MNTYSSRLALLALVLGVLLGTAVNVPLAISEPTISGWGGGVVGVPIIFQPGTAAAPAIGFTTNNGTSDQIGIWKNAANGLSVGNGPTGTTSTFEVRSNNSLLFATGEQGANVNINSNGHLVFGVDNNNDIGASGAVRPRTMFIANKINYGSFVFANIATVLTANGDAAYCSDCKVTTGTAGAPNGISDNTATSGGNGCLVIRENSINRCVQ